MQRRAIAPFDAKVGYRMQETSSRDEGNEYHQKELEGKTVHERLLDSVDFLIILLQYSDGHLHRALLKSTP